MDIPEKNCSVCQNRNEPQATICKYCGASLSESKYTTTKNAQIKINYTNKPEEIKINEAVIPKEGIAIYFAETTKPFVVQTDKEFIVGRKVIETSETVLDLSDFDGFKMGLSRRHAMIRQTESGYEIIDLSSTNGTWLNDKRLEPYTPYPLPSGSRLHLSRIRLFVFYQTDIKNKKE